MRLWIIGNGFDLYHGLRTRYADYKDYLCHRHACDFVKKQRASCSQELSREVCNYCCMGAGDKSCPVRKFNDLPRSKFSESLWRDLEEACAVDLNGLMDQFLGEFVGGHDRLEDSAVNVLVDGALGFAKSFTGYEFYDWLLEVEKSLSDIREKFVGIYEGDVFLTFKLYDDSSEGISYTKQSNMSYSWMCERCGGKSPSDRRGI